jgi:hypothetical protein
MAPGRKRLVKGDTYGGGAREGSACSWSIIAVWPRLRRGGIAKDEEGGKHGPVGEVSHIVSRLELIAMNDLLTWLDFLGEPTLVI